MDLYNKTIDTLVKPTTKISPTTTTKNSSNNNNDKDINLFRKSVLENNDTPYSIYSTDFNNHFILDDLVITYPMNEKEICNQRKVRQRYMESRQIFSSKDLSIEEKRERIKEVLNEFEYQQFEMSNYHFFGQTPTDDNAPHKPDFDCLTENYPNYSYASLDYPKKFFKSSIKKTNNRIPHLYRLRQYDRSGYTFRILQNILKNDQLFLKMYFNSVTMFNREIYKDENNIRYSADFVRISKNNQLVISKLIIPQPSFIDKYTLLYFEGKSNLAYDKKIEYSTDDIDHCIKKFKSTFLNLTGKEYNPNLFKQKNQEFNEKDNSNSDDNKIIDQVAYDNLDRYFYQQVETFPNSNNIPTLKNICYSVIRQLLLNNPMEFKNILNILPIEILEGLLVSCKYDQTPLGFYVFQTITEQCKSNNIKIDSLTQDKVIRIASNHDYWFAFSFEKSICQNIFFPQFNTNYSINVYENMDKFKRKQWPIENQILLKSEKSNYNSDESSIVDFKSFKNTFNTYTHNRLDENIFNWDNILVCGGMVTMCLTGDLESFDETDINIYFYGLSEEQIIARISQFINNLVKQKEWDQYSMVKTLKGSIVLSKHFPYRHISFHLEPYYNINHILVCCDIECCSFGYDGKNVYSLYKSMESINYRCNFISKHSWVLNGDIHYQNRLLKYYERGYSLISFDLKFFERHQKEDFEPHNNHSGLALLVAMARDPNVKQFIKSSILPIPYGKDIKKDNFESLIRDHILLPRYQLIQQEYLDIILSNISQHPPHRKYISLSSNMFPFISVSPKFE
ncbi:hypothetical protein CYY_002816 [Polysphondylium violaceum]|uniref:Uncharacterized protein n=1 Tax=Polysphondylium violaceum TaxID=133409 RepID=A0A8J4PY82_9MYCE|nr:hypothetical protein CYY_002816 [Polysphondylium violaceum]